MVCSTAQAQAVLSRFNSIPSFSVKCWDWTVCQSLMCWYGYIGWPRWKVISSRNIRQRCLDPDHNLPMSSQEAETEICSSEVLSRYWKLEKIVAKYISTEQILKEDGIHNGSDTYCIVSDALMQTELIKNTVVIFVLL